MSHSSSHLSGRGGFTLIELLVTMAILAIILTMAVQVAESSRMSIRLAESQAFNDAIARQTFDRINRDVAQMVVREDARIEFKSMPGNDQFAFLTRTTGFTAAGAVADRGVALVSYSLVHDASVGQKLLRGSCGHLFAGSGNDALNLNPDLPFPAITADNVQVLSNNVIRLELEYLVQASSGGVTREISPPLIPPLAPPGSPPVAAQTKLRGFVVTLATLDAWALRAVKPERLVALAVNFPDASLSANTLKVWSEKRDALAKSGIPGLPKAAVKSIHCYQRTLLIP